MAKEKELVAEDPKVSETAKELVAETTKISEIPILVIRKKDDLVTCVELAPEGYERMQTELKNCEENKSEQLKSVWEGYKVATSEEVKAYKAKAKLTTIFSNE